MNPSRPADTSDLLVDDGAPWIGVHVLAEFIFCPRAGLIAFEQRRSDPGQELGDSPRLDYLPDFEVHIIEAAIQKTWNQIWAVVTWTLPAVLAVSVATYLGDWRVRLLLLAGSVWAVRRLVRWLVARWRDVAELSRRLQAARAATPAAPDPQSTEMQPVNWWELRKSGFDALEYEDPHEDPDWRIAGGPWRVLQDGPRLIPVFRKRRGKPELKRQQLARMAAYCHLMEVAEQAESPYAVVLFGDGYEGVTVPNTSDNRETFHDGLRRLRRFITAVESEGLIPDIPGDQSICRRCHRGFPRVYRKGGDRYRAAGTRAGTLPYKG